MCGGGGNHRVRDERNFSSISFVLDPGSSEDQRTNEPPFVKVFVCLCVCVFVVCVCESSMISAVCGAKRTHPGT